MGKSWFSAVKKAFSPEPKQKKDQKPHKAKKWFGKSKKLDVTNSGEADSPRTVKDAKLKEIEEQQSRHAYSVAIATAAAAEAAVAAAQAAAEVVRLSALSRFPGKSKEEIAAIKIQTAFRGYMARRALRALRGLVRLKSLVQGKCVRRQATSTLQSMQTLARVQYQIRERRHRLSEDKQALTRQLQQKHNKDFDKTGENWNDSTLSREKVEANMLNKQVATMRRERALAYAFTHQNTWKNSSKMGSQTFMDPNNPHWGWSWLERWMAARPNENQSVILTPDNADKESSARSVASRAMSEMVPRGKNLSPRGKTPNSRRGSSPRVRQVPSEDSNSILSIQSEQPCNRRHSTCGSIPSTRDDESFTSSFSQSVPGYMAPTQAAKARARFSNLSPLSSEKTAKKRLSFSGSPKTVRRFSGPPKLESNVTKKDTNLA
ncbi:IQ motif EF-hand binding site [Arabidopsis thaliana x Arabidopsis arenosa]|uniref:IQ motif EF-hand binding site n=1 Tax=Arabidopsis thaliana x Arabidopsis arenosa TaxID=1240361 RepID=A0A8T1ZND0_9BRAS|nr:IQ motif EF-hand binding site [Arabidopsis thaliana x Arabidopsis arenosa]KAG7560569.1 IQ motif EF-hand binding site [Arabidopsis thaliana x Arabidopsis arenosa]KAG7560570.1 IQ motif EF-hand binding site [Arabidopsis thaliana x Arabidopsis arenosa]